MEKIKIACGKRFIDEYGRTLAYMCPYSKYLHKFYLCREGIMTDEAVWLNRFDIKNLKEV